MILDEEVSCFPVAILYLVMVERKRGKQGDERTDLDEEKKKFRTEQDQERSALIPQRK